MSKILSIITVNLNNFKGLEMTMDSVFKQSFQEFEFIIIDGGSNDGSETLINSHSDRLHYWVSEKDNGIFHAMNKGIQRSTGEYLLFLNSGDWLIDSNSLRNVFDQKCDSDIIITGTRVSENGKIIHTTLPKDEISLMSFWKSTLPHPSCFIKKELFDNYGLYDEKLKLHGDYDFWIRTIVLNNASVKTAQFIIADYNLDGISSNINQLENSKLEISEILKRYIPIRILSDYESWYNDSKEREAINWFYEKSFFRIIVNFTYKFSVMIVGVLKNKKINV